MATTRKPASRTLRVFRWLCAMSCLVVLVALGGVWSYGGIYGLHVLIRHGGTWWLSVGTDSARLSPSMRLTLKTDPVATPGKFAWQEQAEGFDVADLPAMVNGQAVDRVMLARIDPAHFRFEVRSASDGDKDLDQWMARLKAVLVVNGSYYARDGTPDTPLLSNGVLLGPRDYNAQAGTFVAGPNFTGIRDLAHTDWKAVFQGVENAMVSYPLLVVDGTTRVPRPSRWLANRSFIGQDLAGRIIIGTTQDAFFSLNRFARFLLDAPLGLSLALNLDGGPVACQGISLNGFQRRVYGRWETQVEDTRVELLTWPYGTIALPVVLAVFPR